jgi:hypothetical protein
MTLRTPLAIAPAIFAVYMPMCAARVQPAQAPWDAHMTELWRRPADVADGDLFYGPWGPERAPDPSAVYTFVATKQHGTNPGVTVKDPLGREWHVKQPPANDQGAEGPIEVVLSRVLSAVGYHQPPVYFMPSFTVVDPSGTHQVVGGRFRLHVASMRNVGTWSWQQNPFVGTRPYQGLLAILLFFGSSDLKNDNNTLYEVRSSNDEVETWYVVRDLGTALGETARLFPKRGDPDIFEHEPFIKGVKDGFVEFNYHGWHQELVRNRITPDDLAWATEHLAAISARQWADAFHAGGYDPVMAARFVRALQNRIAESERLVAEASNIRVFDTLGRRPRAAQR